MRRGDIEGAAPPASVAKFVNGFSAAAAAAGSRYPQDSSGSMSHSHGHTHDRMQNAGNYVTRFGDLKASSTTRSNWDERAFTVGIGGPVGSGKSALVLGLCEALRSRLKLAVITNDIFTKEDFEFLTRNNALPPTQLSAVETGGCPHAAIREDFSMNLEEVLRLTAEHKPDAVFIESGGDNLAANFSRELADYIIYVIDVAGGDKVPRKGGPGVTQSDLLVINKSDLCEAVGASLEIMLSDAHRMRSGGPVVVTQARHNVGIDEVANAITRALTTARS